MEGARGGEKSRGKENEEEQKSENLKKSEKDKGKVNFIARNREAAGAGGGRQGREKEGRRKGEGRKKEGHPGSQNHPDKLLQG